MSASASIQKMSIKHEEILNFLLLNPTRPIGEVAAFFGVTFPWMSTIIHSAAFQNQLKLRQNEVFDSAVLGTVEDKLSAAAQVTLDAYLAKVPMLTADQLISSNDKLLNRLGYGSRPNGATHIKAKNVQINMVEGDILKEARDRIGKSEVGQANSQPALQDLRTHGAIETEGVLVRREGESETPG